MPDPIHFMSKDPASPVPQEEAAPEKKTTAKAVKKKSAGKKARPAKTARSVDVPDPGEKTENVSAEPPADTKPAPKKVVRNAKKAASKKSAAKKSADATDGQVEPSADETARKQARRGRGRNRGRQEQPKSGEPKVKLDNKKVAKRAWKIFLGEVNEEGLALIGDKDARELARRSIRVAEIYAREEALEVLKRKKKKADKPEKAH